MDSYTSQLFPSSPTGTSGVQLLNFVSHAGLDSDVLQGQGLKGQHVLEIQTRPDLVSGTQLYEEGGIRQPSVSAALEELEEGLNDLCDVHTRMPRRIILDKLQQNLVAVKLEAHQKQEKIDQLEGEKASILEHKEKEENCTREKAHRLNIQMIEMTKKLQCENEAVIDSLFRKFSMKEQELLMLQTQLAEKEKEQYQSSVKINQLQVELRQLSQAIESLKAKYELLCWQSNERKMASETSGCGGLYSKSHCTEQRTPLSLDQRIMKARATRKQSRIHKCDTNYEHELAVELEIARIRSCSREVDRMLEMQYGEVQKLVLRWKATGSDQIMRIWTF